MKTRPILPIAAIAFGLALFAALPALAALPAPGSGTIALQSSAASVQSVASSTSYQSTVSFAVSYSGRLKNPRVWLACYQDAQLVYGEGGSPSTAFKLGGNMSEWVIRGGGAANCTAELYYIKKAGSNTEWSGNGPQERVWLASTVFNATA